MRYRWIGTEKMKESQLHVDVPLPQSKWGDGSFQMELLSPIREIPGVTYAFNGKYSIEIRKAELFEWKTIQPQVEAIVKALFSPDADMIAV